MPIERSLNATALSFGTIRELCAIGITPLVILED